MIFYFKKNSKGNTHLLGGEWSLRAIQLATQTKPFENNKNLKIITR